MWVNPFFSFFFVCFCFSEHEGPWAVTCFEGFSQCGSILFLRVSVNVGRRLFSGFQSKWVSTCFEGFCECGSTHVLRVSVNVGQRLF